MQLNFREIKKSDRCRAEFCTLPDYASPSVGKFRSRCGGGVRIRGGVGIRQSGSDFNEGMHNLAGVQISAQHRTCYLGLSYSLGLYFAGGTGLACSLMGEMCDAHGPGPARLYDKAQTPQTGLRGSKGRWKPEVSNNSPSYDLLRLLNKVHVNSILSIKL